MMKRTQSGGLYTVYHQQDLFKLTQMFTKKKKKIVCFDTNKHSCLNQAELSKSPIKLESISQVPNREDGTKSDVLINHRSVVTTAIQLSFKCRDSGDGTATARTRSIIRDGGFTVPQTCLYRFFAVTTRVQRCQPSMAENRSKSHQVTSTPREASCLFGREPFSEVCKVIFLSFIYDFPC